MTPVPDGVDPSVAIMCQTLGTVLYSCSRAGSVLGKRVVVVGQGAIGLLFTTVLAMEGASVVVGIDPLDYRLGHALAHGATATVNPAHEDPVTAVERLTKGGWADVVVEASGTEEGANQAYDFVRPHGTVVVFGLPEDDVVRFNYMKMVRKQATILPTVSAATPDYPAWIASAVALTTSGRLDVSWLVTNRQKFVDAPAAYEMYERRSGGVLKVVLEV